MACVWLCLEGVYGDQVNEMSWAVGQVLDVVRELHIERTTLALFFSDHGPHIEICEEGGSAAPFRGYTQDVRLLKWAP